MTLLHLPCGHPMVQLTPVVDGMPDPEKSTAWCLHCAATDSGRPAGETITDRPTVLGVDGWVQRPVLVGSHDRAAAGSPVAAHPGGAA